MCLEREGILIGEFLGSYALSIETLILMGTRIKPEEVLVAPANRILTENYIRSFGLRVAKLVIDQRRLKEDLKDDLGSPCNSKISSCTHAIIDNDDEIVLNHNYESAKSCACNDAEN